MFTVGAPAAHATTTHWFSDAFYASTGSVLVDMYYDDAGNTYEAVTVHNNLVDSNHCVEGWVDIWLSRHRPANPFTACRNSGGSYYSGLLPLHWPRSDSLSPNAAVPMSAFTNTTHVKLAVCAVNTNYGASGDNWMQRDPLTCQQYPGNNVGALNTTGNTYTQISWQDINNLPWPNGTSFDMRPEYVNRGNIDLLGTDTHLNTGEMLVSWDGNHKVVMQSDGNLVVYNDIPGHGAIWASASCHVAGFGFATSGSYATLQSGDGNFVVYGPSAASWASANGNSCPPFGSFGGGGQYLKMQNDGNLVEYYTGGSLWNSGTGGR